MSRPGRAEAADVIRQPHHGLKRPRQRESEQQARAAHHEHLHGPRLPGRDRHQDLPVERAQLTLFRAGKRPKEQRDRSRVQIAQRGQQYHQRRRQEPRRPGDRAPEDDVQAGDYEDHLLKVEFLARDLPPPGPARAREPIGFRLAHVPPRPQREMPRRSLARFESNERAPREHRAGQGHERRRPPGELRTKGIDLERVLRRQSEPEGPDELATEPGGADDGGREDDTAERAPAEHREPRREAHRGEPG